jgi:hypothetical protein
VFRLDIDGSSVATGQSMVLEKAQKFFGKLSEWANSPVLESVLAMAPPTTTTPSQPDSTSSSPAPAPRGVVSKLFHSSRSFATFRIPEASSGISSVLSGGGSSSGCLDLRVIKTSKICGPICAFSKTKPNHVIVIHHNGLMYEFSFDESGRRHSGGSQEGTFIGACAYFQARPDFSIQKSSPSIAPATRNSDSDDDSNWHVL